MLGCDTHLRSNQLQADGQAQCQYGSQGAWGWVRTPHPGQWEPRGEEREKTKMEVLTQTKSVSLKPQNTSDQKYGHPVGDQSKEQESERIRLGANRKPQPSS